MRERNSDPAIGLLPAVPAWFTAVLKPLQAVNVRLLNILALAPEVPTESPWPLALELRELLRQMDPATRARAAACSFLWVNAGFRDVQRWSRVRSRAESVDTCDEYFPHREAVELAQMTLTLAWSLVRFNRDAACIMLGFSPACADLVADLDPSEVHRIATKHSAWIRPRWENRPDVWRRLLGMPDRSGSQPHAISCGQGLYLFFGDVLKPPQQALHP